MPDESHKLDGLATGVADGTISRGRAIKLAGAALVGSALSVFVAEDAEAETRRGIRARRRRCRNRHRRFCMDRVGSTNRSRCCDPDTTSTSRCRRGRCGGRNPTP